MTEHLANPSENPAGDSNQTGDAGLFSRVENTRNIRGLLLPFGELSRPNASGNESVQFTAGSVKLPRDASVVTLNTEHDRFNPIGRAVSLEETAEGIVAEFQIADTDEGDAYLANPLRKLSAEVAGLVRDAADKTRATFARLTGAAAVHEGAFASAALFSLVGDEALPDPDTDPDGYAAALDEIRDRLAAVQALITDLSPAPAEESTPPAAPAEESTEENTKEFSNMTDSVTDAGAQVPATLLGNAPAHKEADLNAVFSAMSAIKSSAGAQTADQETFLAALSDIKAESSGGLTTAGSGVIPPTFAGRLFQGKRYTERYISLANYSHGGINIAGRKGWKLSQGTALVQEIANAAQKVELPSGTATTSLYSSSLRKFGYAADVALEWQYLEGGAEIMAAFWEGVADSYAKNIDEAALATLFSVASKNSTALDRLVAPGTYPTQYPAAMGQLIQGIDLIADNGDDATFAIVNPTAWTQLLFTPKDLVPEFVEFGVGLGTGEGTAGKVRVVKAPQSFFTGTVAANPQVIVGAKGAVEFREQMAEINALEVAKFGVDRATVGFLETFIVRPESLALIGTKP